MQRLAAFLGQRQGAVIGAVLLSQSLYGCAVEQAVAPPEFEKSGSELENPLLKDFIAICLLAMSNATGSYHQARERGWVDGPADPTGREFHRMGGLSQGGFTLMIGSLASDSGNASRCSILGLQVSPAFAAGISTFELPSYTATNEEFPSGTTRRLEGTAPFGDPLLIELTASVAQGAAVVDLSMTNLAKPQSPLN